MDENMIEKRLEFAREIAVEAGELTLKYFQDPCVEVERKSDDSPVTIADKQAEQHLRQRIEERFPEDAILGEEFGESAGTSGLRWILDPIDGTKSFIHGVPLYTTLIGVERDRNALLGIIYAPATRELVSAAKGCGAEYRIGDRPAVAARVSEVESLGESLFLTTSVASFSKDRKPDAREVYVQLLSESRLSRTWGDAYGYLLVATGRAEVMIDPAMNIWDAAAILPVLEEAGGTFTDWNGMPRIDGGEGIGTNGKVLAEVLKWTRSR